MAAKIEKYTVLVEYSTITGRTRILILHSRIGLPAPDHSQYDTFFISFVEQERFDEYVQEHNGFGEYKPTDTTLHLLMPLSEFDHHYKVLQTEEPVHATWQRNVDNQIFEFRIGAPDEPVGEGPKDAADR